MAASFPRLWTLAVTTAALSTADTFTSVVLGSSAADASCSGANKTLSSSCGGLCGEDSACLVYDANAVGGYSCTDCASDGQGVCEYECFLPDNEYDDGTRLYLFFVTFASYESDAEAVERSDNPFFDEQVDALPDFTGDYENASNDQVEAIGKLDVPVKTTDVLICGGTTCTPPVRGKMALVTFTGGFLSSNEQVTSVGLANLFLGGQVDDLPSLLPPATTYLQLSNVLLLDFPSAVGSISNLISLRLDWNYIKTIDSTAGLDQLRYLDVQYNLLDTFDVNFPRLEYLNLSHNFLLEIPSTSLALDRLDTLDLGDNELTVLEGSFPYLMILNLSGNAFTEIPPIVFELTYLNEFYFAGNPLVNFSFTSTQIQFLNNLTTLDVRDWTTTSVALPCDVEAQVKLRWITVCQSDTPAPTPTPKPGPYSRPNLGLIIGIVAGGVVLVVVIALIVWCAVRRSRNAQKDVQTEGDNCQYYANNDNNYPTEYSSERQSSQYRRPSTQPTDFNPGYPNSYERLARGSSSASASGATVAQEHHSLQELWNDPDLLSLQLRSEDIREIRVLETGAYGVVWLVQYRESQLLASKRLRREMITRARTQEFVIEIKLVAGFSHPNIVEFIGAAWHNDMGLQALFEFMENGDLRSFLTRPDVPHEWTLEKLQLAIDMVEALVYVHSFKPPLVHRDLKSRNVLVSREMRAKLTDFSVSRFQSSDSTMTMGVGTSRWLAPEIILGTTDYNQSTDVFSVGVVLSELDTHQLPYDDAVGPSGNKYEEIAIMQRVANGALRPSFSTCCPNHIVEIAHLCMAQEQADRPSSAEVAYVLRTLRRQMLQEQQQQQ